MRLSKPGQKVKERVEQVPVDLYHERFLRPDLSCWPYRFKGISPAVLELVDFRKILFAAWSAPQHAFHTTNPRVMKQACGTQNHCTICMPIQPQTRTLVETGPWTLA